jgi:hypothetical protein
MRASFTDSADFDVTYTPNAGASATVTNPNQKNNGNGDPVEYKILGN